MRLIDGDVEMNKEQLKQDIETMKARLASMEAELSKPVKSKAYIPLLGTCFYYINLYGVVITDICEDANLHNTLISTGNCYRTQEEAEKARDKQLAYVRVTRKLRELEGDWVADWKDICQSRFYIYYNCFTCGFGCLDISTMKMTEIAMYSTQKACQWVIDNMADDLKLIFDVE